MADRDIERAADLAAEGVWTHLHRCPECGAEQWHETTQRLLWCASAARASEGGVARLLCDLCWGMRRPTSNHSNVRPNGEAL